MTSLPFSTVPGNRSYRYIACSVKLVVRGSLLQLHKVRDILNDAPLQQLIITPTTETPTTETPTIQLTDDNDSDTTIIYDISVVAEAFFHWSGKFIPSIFIAHFVLKGTMLLKFEFEIIKEN